jgi:hypothetical protein
VHTELSRSPSWRVRDAVDAHETEHVDQGVPPDDPEDLPY